MRYEDRKATGQFTEWNYTDYKLEIIIHWANYFKMPFTSAESRVLLNAIRKKDAKISKEKLRKIAMSIYYIFAKELKVNPIVANRLKLVNEIITGTTGEDSITISHCSKHKDSAILAELNIIEEKFQSNPNITDDFIVLLTSLFKNSFEAAGKAFWEDLMRICNSKKQKKDVQIIFSIDEEIVTKYGKSDTYFMRNSIAHGDYNIDQKAKKILFEFHDYHNKGETFLTDYSLSYDQYYEYVFTYFFLVIGIMLYFSMLYIGNDIYKDRILVR